MARRSRSGIQPLWLAAGIGILVAGFGAGVLFFSEAGEPFRTVAPLEVAAYLENSNSLRGNVYRVKGEILDVIAFSPAEGRLISVGVDAGGEVIPMLIPSSLGHVNIQKGQHFIFKIEVAENGILRAQDLVKS